MVAEWPQEVVDYVKKVSEFACELNLECNLGILPQESEACAEFVGNMLVVDRLSADLEKGRVRFDIEKAHECVLRLSSLTCVDAWQFFSHPTAEIALLCSTVLSGALTVGDACSSDNDCEFGHYCEFALEAASGVCQRVVRQCADSMNNVVGNCELNENCIDGGCVPRLKEQQKCKGVENSYECEKDLICVDNLCVKKSALGNECSEQLGCERGLRCEHDGICRAPQFGLGLGDICDDVWLRCGNGLFCEKTDGVCSYRIKSGQMCESSDACEIGHLCVNGICKQNTSWFDSKQPEMDTIQQAVWLSPVNWNVIDYWASFVNTYDIGSQYGKAIGKASFNQLGASSGWLQGDFYFTMSHHAWRSKSYPSTVDVNFGMIASPPIAYQYARTRLAQIHGINYSDANSVPFATLSQWQCVSPTSYGNSNHGYRDIVYFYCPPKTILGKSVFPADIWGRLYHESGMFSNGNSMYVLQRNSLSPGVEERVILSPDGSIYNRDYGCLTGSGYDNCFEFHGADTQPGSSGGPILSLVNGQRNRVKGGVHGAFCFGGCSGWTTYPNGSYWYTNSAAYLPSYFSSDTGTIAHSDPDGPVWQPLADPLTSLPPGAFYRGSWIGGSGGSLSQLRCPPTFSAVGIIGSNGYGGDVGNLGLVCGRWSHSSMRFVSGLVVVSVGSYDTDFYTTGIYGDSFHMYVNEVLVNDANRQQIFRLCPYGYFLSGLSGKASNLLHSVSTVVCKKHDVASWGPYLPLTPLAIGINSHLGTSFSTTCPTNSVVVGLRLRSGWVSDGFELICHQVP